jgi:hypothetical protein
VLALGGVERVDRIRHRGFVLHLKVEVDARLVGPPVNVREVVGAQQVEVVVREIRRNLEQQDAASRDGHEDALWHVAREALLDGEEDGAVVVALLQQVEVRLARRRRRAERVLVEDLLLPGLNGLL